MINITLGGVAIDQIEQPLTKQEVQAILEKANIGVVNGESYGYRLGQAIYNELPYRIAHILDDSDQDMFHIMDEDIAVTMLLNLAEKM